LKLLDERELVIEVEESEDFQRLQKKVQETFGGEVNVEAISKR
jgi:hypothetical protein